MLKTLIFAHRGASGTHPENTMTAFQAALDDGADGIELDVQLTKDRVPVIIHDETVNRTTDGQGWVKDYTYEELKKLDAGGWFHPAFHGAAIPTLEAVLEWLAPTSLLLNIELKNGIVRYPGIEEIVLKLIKKYDVKNRVIISSFNHYSLVEVHRLDPDVETAVLFMEGLYEPWEYAKALGANGLHCFLPVAVPELLAGAAKAMMPVRPFTVNEDQHIRALINGCDAIITDWPEKAVIIRKQCT
ncbi:glycerophosphoryl diester phosphodiesterase [Evansella caseinilytica]|uniref:Glycerophosphoryl diester phosphodiesterase n=1 Tax=Evansella caseinilytica TaxID=1503961 RepID=A0A1H3L1Z5_9BACI|nr:glycerophosphodiester phosphodiesterase [Evansella caseinilytica]SDY58421.1 glycerophosphoryl diester phosphodiesterase [Evansella caseinilytica]